MPKWEHVVVRRDETGWNVHPAKRTAPIEEGALIVDVLDRLGADGWELAGVATTAEPDRRTFYFKRELT